jgi:O-acetyl-ADP-ribose deacetylase (regulator of RNase III)
MTVVPEVIDADITTLDVDAIVNAANRELAPGGGVCGAIHCAAGQELAKACAGIGGCPTGEARITEGYDLLAKWVIHTVGPVWGGGESGEDRLLYKCYDSSLKLAEEHGAASIAFPAISTGIYGFPAHRAARIAVAATLDYLRAAEEMDVGSLVSRIIFCCFGQESVRLHKTALEEYGHSH